MARIELKASEDFAYKTLVEKIKSLVLDIKHGG
jgi:hypothetical protein